MIWKVAPWACAVLFWKLLGLPKSAIMNNYVIPHTTDSFSPRQIRQALEDLGGAETWATMTGSRSCS